MMRRTIAARIRYYREADAEPDVNIAIQPTGRAKERGRTTDPIAWRDEGEPAAAHNARVAKALTMPRTRIMSEFCAEAAAAANTDAANALAPITICFMWHSQLAM